MGVQRSNHRTREFLPVHLQVSPRGLRLRLFGPKTTVTFSLSPAGPTEPKEPPGRSPMPVLDLGSAAGPRLTTERGQRQEGPRRGAAAGLADTPVAAAASAAQGRRRSWWRGTRVDARGATARGPSLAPLHRNTSDRVRSRRQRRGLRSSRPRLAVPGKDAACPAMRLNRCWPEKCICKKGEGAKDSGNC